MKFNAKQIQQATGGIFLVEPRDTTVFAVRAEIDSRKVQCGDMFVALPGTRVDGHEFIDVALRNRASVVLCEKPIQEKTKLLAIEMNASIIQVDDCAKSLVNVATQWRNSIRAKVVGLTGSSGKTSTKNLIADVLSSEMSTTATKGNHNNELGVPITLTESEPENKALVVEMGMRGLGQIKSLCSYVQPDWGLITNVGESHIELLGSRENIAIAKGELAEAVPNTIGKMFLYADDDYRDFIIDRAKLNERNVEVILFGGTEKKDLPYKQVWAEDIEINEEGCPSFSVHTNEGVASCRLKLRGRHNVFNACAAIAVGLEFGISIYDCVKVLNKSLPEVGRQEVIKCPAGFTVINDAYNANPESMKASLIAFKDMHSDGKKIAVLGDMLELGDYSKACHESIGKLVSGLKIDNLICVGEDAKYIASTSNMEDVVLCKNNHEALRVLESIIMPKDLVLIKASNGLKLDYIVKGLRE